MTKTKRLRRTILLGSVFPVVLALCGPGPVVAEPPREINEAREKQPSIEPQILQEVERIVKNIKVSCAAEGETAQLDLLKGPLLQNEFQYLFARGTVWAWGAPGRPQAVLSLSLVGRADDPQWCHEMVSLSAKPIKATTRGNAWWSTQVGGWNPRPIPDAPGVAETPEQRILQMTDLASRFSGHTYYKDPEEIAALRLRKEPILRYGASGDTVDGAVFAFIAGRNDPQILLVIEAERDPQSGATWKYGAAPMSSNALIIKHRDEQVWSRPRVALHGTTATDTYRIYFASAKEEIRLRESEGQTD
jgi:hypothetical protein